jgi:hypothetical protein
VNQAFLDMKRGATLGQPPLPSAVPTPGEIVLAMGAAVVALERRQLAIEVRQDRQDFALAAIQKRRPPEGKCMVREFLQRYSKPYLPKSVLASLNFHCRQTEEAEMFRPDTYDYAQPYYTLDTLNAAYEKATLQLSFLPTSRRVRP